jgi:hypothetical protein
MIHTVLREASTSGQSFSGNFLPSLLYSAHTSVVRMKPGGTGRPMLLICPRHENQELRPMFPAFSSMEEEGIACAGGQRGMGGRGGVCARGGGRGQTSARLAPLPPRRGFMCLPPSDPCKLGTYPSNIRGALACRRRCVCPARSVKGGGEWNLIGEGENVLLAVEAHNFSFAASFSFLLFPVLFSFSSAPS